MILNKIDTTLIKKNSKFTEVCTNCNNKIEKGESYYFEVGLKNHLHSLISRRFCSKCYSKFGEKKLLGIN
jgi:hypothetical protein